MEGVVCAVGGAGFNGQDFGVEAWDRAYVFSHASLGFHSDGDFADIVFSIRVEDRQRG